MDWFEKLTGFRETSYAETRSKLTLAGDQLQSQVNGKSYAIGALELVTLRTLRERLKSAASGVNNAGRLKVSVVTGDVRQMHRAQENAGALFQVASQFNLLEMISPSVTPEQGVARYQNDPTQGPACAIAAGAATIYRNYFASVAGQQGQTAERQLNGLAKLGEMLAETLQMPVEALWNMRNGYALCTQAGLDAISKHLGRLQPEQLEDLRGALAIGVHSDVEVTDAVNASAPGPTVSQAFCSALPVAYSPVQASYWAPFAHLVLEAAYEATLVAAVLNARRGVSNVVLLTRLGGGAFGNHDDWIHSAMNRALKLMTGYDIHVKLVSYGTPSRALLQMKSDFS